MASLDEVLSHALECAARGAFDEARAVLAQRPEQSAAQLAAFVAQQQQRDRDRASSMGKARHDLGNALAIANASIEAMLDGVVEITESRLNRIREILTSVSASMYELTSGDIGQGMHAEPHFSSAGDPIAAEISDLSALAGAKGVRLSYACAADAPVIPSFHQNGAALRTILLSALRYTPDGGSIELRRNARNEVTLSVAPGTVSKVLEAARGTARVLEERGSETIVLIAFA